MSQGSPGRLGGDDATLAAAAASGSSTALAELLARHFDYVHAVCGRILRNPSDAEDARQDALFLAARRIRGFAGRSSFRTWLHRIAVNASLDALARARRAPEPVGDLPEAAVLTRSHEEAVTARLDIDAALARLPDAYRLAVVLRDLCDLDYEEIAGHLGVPIGTVRSRISRGRGELARLLGNRAGAASVEGA